MLEDSFLWTRGELVCPSVHSRGKWEDCQNKSNLVCSLIQIVVLLEQIKVPPKLWSLSQPQDWNTAGHGLTSFAGGWMGVKTTHLKAKPDPFASGKSHTAQIRFLHYPFCTAGSKWGTLGCIRGSAYCPWKTWNAHYVCLRRGLTRFEGSPDMQQVSATNLTTGVKLYPAP